MNTEERTGFITAILNEPADDMARGAYADALRESADVFDQLHGRFVWAGLTLSKFRGTEPVEDGMFFDAIADQGSSARSVIRVRAKHLLGWGPTEWAWDNYPDAPDRVTARLIPPVVDGEKRRERRERRGKPAPMPTITWERGCVVAVGLKLDRWCALAPRILANCPLERVEILDVPGLTLRIVGPEQSGKWLLFGDLKMPSFFMPSHPSVRIPERVLSEPWSMSSRELLAKHIRIATVDTVELLRSQAGDRWPGPV